MVTKRDRPAALYRFYCLLVWRGRRQLSQCLHPPDAARSIRRFSALPLPHCNERIRWADNIPLFSYLALGRKCRHCGAKIISRYFLVELLTAVLFLLLWLKLTHWDDPALHGIYLLKVPIDWMVIAGLIAATFIDFEHYNDSQRDNFRRNHRGPIAEHCLSALATHDLVTDSLLKLSPLQYRRGLRSFSIGFWDAGGWADTSQHCGVWQAPVWSYAYRWPGRDGHYC